MTIFRESKMALESTEYTNLVKNIIVIDKEFRDFDEKDSSNPENQRKLRACISLIHSELESYFELVALKVVDLYQTNRMDSTQAKLFTNSIFFYNHKVYEGQNEDVATRLDKSINLYKASISQNNGIKEKDILKLLLPIGIPLANIDSVWLASINSFGALRGEIMHNSINQITRLIGYRQIDMTIYHIIIPEIEKIDKFLISTYGLI